MAFEEAVQRARRRYDLTALTDDEAARRVPKVVVVDPRRALRTVLAGVRDEQPELEHLAALTKAFQIMPDLREVFERDRLTLGEIAPADLATAIALAKDAPTRRITLGRRHTPTTQEVDMQTVTPPAIDEVLALAKALRVDEPHLTEDEALVRVSRKHPKVYERYRAEQTLDRGGVALASVKVTIEKKKPVSSGGTTEPSAYAIITALVAEIMERTSCSEREALDQALKERPSLYASYTQELKRRIDGGDRFSDE